MPIEIPDEIVAGELRFYEDELVRSFKLKGTREGNTHTNSSALLRGTFLRMGILDDNANHKIVTKALRRAKA